MVIGHCMHIALYIRLFPNMGVTRCIHLQYMMQRITINVGLKIEVQNKNRVLLKWWKLVV